MTAPFLDVANLRVDIPTANGTLHAVRDVSFSIRRGEALGIVGESGSGKSMSALALMGLLPSSAKRNATRLQLGPHDLLAMSDQALAAEVTGNRMSMIFQEPMTSLNPVYTIGRQLTETMMLHKTVVRREATDRALFLLDKVGIPSARSRLGQYPHQLSGGQRQRVMIAMALMNEPELIIADEPTTALDVTIQAQILRLLADLQRELGMTMILITHDLGVVSRTVDRVAVMYAGEIVESGSADEVLRTPHHPYTRGLLDCIPQPHHGSNNRLGSIPGIVPSLVGDLRGCAFANRCALARPDCSETGPPARQVRDNWSYRCVMPPGEAEASGTEAFSARNGAIADTTEMEGATGTARPVLETRDVACVFHVRRGIFSSRQELRAVDGVSLTLNHGDVLAIVGESGCGKTTLAKMLLGLQPPTRGDILLDGTPLFATRALDRTRRIQPIFQDPYSSLNPRKTIGQTITRPLDIHGIGEPGDRKYEVEHTMEIVGLPRRLYHSYPNQISGGQRQRVAIARAIVMKPEVLICDEPTSALDVSVQSQILNLLLDLRAELGLTYLIITHDLGVVEYMATRVAVMYLGEIVELAETNRIFHNPRHPYTRVLLDSLLTMSPGQRIPDTRVGAGFPDPLNLPSGCRFHPRCPNSIDRCKTEVQVLDRENVRCLLNTMIEENATVGM
jgi:peptide/nickel transport system ATP-binding protein